MATFLNFDNQGLGGKGIRNIYYLYMLDTVSKTGIAKINKINWYIKTKLCILRGVM
jgi:hypothetical protein